MPPHAEGDLLPMATAPLQAYSPPYHTYPSAYFVSVVPRTPLQRDRTLQSTANAYPLRVLEQRCLAATLTRYALTYILERVIAPKPTQFRMHVCHGG